MIKPVDSSGSKGINKLTNVDQLKDFIEDALSYSREKRIIIEEFIEKDGYQISGDAFSVDEFKIPLFGTNTTVLQLSKISPHLVNAGLFK